MNRRYENSISDSGRCLQIREIVTSGSGGSSGYCGITAAELAERIAIERAHEDIPPTPSPATVFAAKVREIGGRCSGCGEPIGEDVPRCPICRQPQAITGRRNSARRKTIGGFCGPRPD